jgi:hypothetical protein
MRLPFRVTGSQARLLGAGATYLAVPPGNNLSLSFNGIPQIVTIPFTGAEVGQAAFHAAINAFLTLLGMPTGATAAASVADSAGQSLFVAPFLGTFSGGAVLAASSAAVLASLGIAVGPFAVAVAGLTMVGGLAARQVGGPSQVAGAVNQRFVFLGGGPGRSVMILDRGVVQAVSADSARINPSGLP